MQDKKRYEDIEDYEIGYKLRRIVDEIKKLEKQKQKQKKERKKLKDKNQTNGFLGGKNAIKM